MKDKIEQARNILKEYSQEHIIQLLEKCSGSKKEEIIDKILSIDFTELENLYEMAQKPLDIDISILEPVNALKKEKLSAETIASYYETGTEVILKNKFAVVTMAGGQGTRLRVKQSQRNA